MSAPKSQTPELKAVAKSKEPEFDAQAMRQRLEITPGQADPISRLLLCAIESAETQEDFENSVEGSISQLIKALRIARGDE